MLHVILGPGRLAYGPVGAGSRGLLTLQWEQVVLRSSQSTGGVGGWDGHVWDCTEWRDDHDEHRAAVGGSA